MRLFIAAGILTMLTVAMRISEAAAAGQYRLVDLDQFHPSDINNAGQITGIYPKAPLIHSALGLLMPNQYEAEPIDLGGFQWNFTGARINSMGKSPRGSLSR